MFVSKMPVGSHPSFLSLICASDIICVCDFNTLPSIVIHPPTQASQLVAARQSIVLRPIFTSGGVFTSQNRLYVLTLTNFTTITMNKPDQRTFNNCHKYTQKTCLLEK